MLRGKHGWCSLLSILIIPQNTKASQPSLQGNDLLINNTQIMIIDKIQH